jgi:hypothetical protein
MTEGRVALGLKVEAGLGSNQHELMHSINLPYRSGTQPQAVYIR